MTTANFISQLLPQLYDDQTLMTHSLHGRKPNKFKDGYTLKNGLPAVHKAQLNSKSKYLLKAVLTVLIFLNFFVAVATQKAAALAGKPEVGKTEIFRAVSVKLGNEHKKLKK